MSTPTATHPRPLFIVHLLAGAFSAACGRWAGQRRFDAERGTFVQDTCHTTLWPDRNPEGFETCPTCLDAQLLVTGAVAA